MFRRFLGRQNTINALELAVVTLAFTAICAWCVSVGYPEILWTLRIAAPLAAIVVAWRLVSVLRQPEKLPDLLREVAKKYFEAKGLCFVPVFRAKEGRFGVSIYFQNRYSRHASARVVLQPPRPFWPFKPKLTPITALIECPGGAFGALHLSYPVPPCYCGKRATFAIGAQTRYRQGRGELLRFRGGMRATHINALGTAHRIAETLIALCLGFLYTSRPSTVNVLFPAEIAPPIDPSPSRDRAEILWHPDFPTRRFPINPPRAAA